MAGTSSHASASNDMANGNINQHQARLQAAAAAASIYGKSFVYPSASTPMWYSFFLLVQSATSFPSCPQRREKKGKWTEVYTDMSYKCNSGPLQSYNRSVCMQCSTSTCDGGSMRTDQSYSSLPVNHTDHIQLMELCILLMQFKARFIYSVKQILSQS